MTYETRKNEMLDNISDNIKVLKLWKQEGIKNIPTMFFRRLLKGYISLTGEQIKLKELIKKYKLGA